MTNKELADLIYPNISSDINIYEKKYPERKLPDGAVVSRFAPSPTGFVHMGSLLSAFIESFVPKITQGVFYLRIEDTDGKRTVENGINGIIKDLKDFNIIPDEGVISETESKGEYGPYIQSQRKEIYETYVKKLIEDGLAYPCFCTEKDLTIMREKQEHKKTRIGYYGNWAKCRNLTNEERAEKIKNGEKYIIRLKSPGSFEHKIILNDLVRGKIEMPENDIDVVLIKGDGLPIYHFAHVIDDHLMRTTHVLRGEEWISSYPIHTQLFDILRFKEPKYGHLGVVMKVDETGTRRKLSKRKDPEAAVSYYHEQGIPADAVVEYLLNIANSTFEPWRRANPDKNISEFELQLNKMSVSGAVFDMVKLLDVSKNVISKYSGEKIYKETLAWANKYDKEFANLLKENEEYSIKVLNIERGKAKPRKDIAKWSDVKASIEYMYNNIFEKMDNYEFQKIEDKEEIKNILKSYIEKHFDVADDKETWFNKMKDLAEENGYAREVKEFKQNPENYKGHVGDISTVIRVALTTRHNTPDLYEIMQVLGKEEVEKRIQSFIS